MASPALYVKARYMGEEDKPFFTTDTRVVTPGGRVIAEKIHNTSCQLFGYENCALTLYSAVQQQRR